MSRALAACSIWPCAMTTTVSATAMASSWVWVTCTKVMPSSFCTRRSSPRMRRRRYSSSADSGSSSSSTRGLVISARASATRCCWPPESWAGRRSANFSSWTLVSSSRALAWRVGGAGAAHLQRKGHVVEHAAMREQRVALEHHGRAALAPAAGRAPTGRRCGCRRWSASRGRRSCAGSWSCRSRSAPAGSNRSRAGWSRLRSLTAMVSPKRLVTPTTATSPLA